MKRSITILLTVLLFHSVFGQGIISGDYGSGLKLFFDSATKKVTGCFEDYTGSDEQTNSPRFSCVFYLEGRVSGQRFSIKTYYPTDKKEDLILGTIEIVTSKKVKIKLSKEHGGCWNVQPFADEPVTFMLEKSQKWTQIRYVDVPKAHFYSDKAEHKRLKSYLVKRNFVCIGKVEGKWAYCVFSGKKITKGWLRLSDLNEL